MRRRTRLARLESSTSVPNDTLRKLAFSPFRGYHSRNRETSICELSFLERSLRRKGVHILLKQRPSNSAAMDLRSVLNTSDNGDRAPGKEPPTPQQQQQQRHSSHPLQSPVQYGYREYGQHSAHPSPGKPPPEYQRSSQHQHPSAYPPPSPYQGAAGPYPLRSQQPHAVPPNPSSFIDARQPAGIAPQTQTQYRPGPTHASPPAAASGYPFTQAHSGQDMTSPSQRHQYPPNHYSHQPHSNDGYPQNALAQGSGGYAQQHTVPQTPPIGTNNGPSAQYIHQRSQSTHSTPTPTSAHSQQQFGPPHLHGSPVPTSRSISEYRQPSQPPTPLGPPQSATSFRHTGPPGPANQAQPSSPYQQRIASHGSGLPPSSSPHAGTPLRRASGPNAADALSETHSRSNSKHDRENSPSVSPKTRVASIAGSSDKAMTSPVDVDRQSMVTQGPDMEVDRGIIPAKRKLNDRSLSPSELEHKEARPAPAEVNGSHPARLTGSSSFSASKRSRTLHAQPPVWAQSGSTLGNKMPKHANFVLQKRIHSHINGKVAGASKSDHQSRQASPDPAKTSFSGPSGKVAAPAAASATDPGPQDTLGPWEASLIGVKPYEEISKTVADFIFINVLNNPDFKEIMNRGIQFEIEAKLGTLIDKDTNHRVDRMLDSECILHDNGRVAFRSSMTEVCRTPQSWRGTHNQL